MTDVVPCVGNNLISNHFFVKMISRFGTFVFLNTSFAPMYIVFFIFALPYDGFF